MDASVNKKDYIFVEYQTLRDEINHLNGFAATAMNFSVVLVIALLGFLAQLKTPTFALFFVPFVVLVPSSYMVLSRFQAIFRIGTYIEGKTRDSHEWHEDKR